jgi:hypothetical protein
MLKKILIVCFILLGAALILAACGAKPTPEVKEVKVEVTREVTVTQVVQVTVAPVVAAVPFQDAWAGSAHHALDTEPFKHWDTADPKEVPTSCARCHTSAGFVDYATDGKVDAAVSVANGNPGIMCETCHSPEAMALTSVTFPSGKVIQTSEEGEARCMTCHQGRESKVSVDKQINDTFKVTDADAVVAPIKDDKGNPVNFGFRNIHYFAAGATLYGSQAQGGYEYDGKVYDPKFRHVDGFDTCLGCHDQHSLKVKVDKCAECHTNVKTVDDLKNNRMNGSLEDYNGNGDVKEGIATELAGLQDILYSSIQAYANEVSKTPIVYDATAYPYFFVADKDGKVAKDDKGNSVGYNAWTARLLKAAYNYQVSVKDPGAFAHNAKYIVELLYDSIDDLNGKVSQPVAMGKLHRDDAAHFAGNTEPFRHWDAQGEVAFACAKCHSATGLPEFIKNGGSLVLTPSGSLTVAGIGNQPIANGFMCATCHDDLTKFTRRAVTTVPFPSGVSLTFSTEKDDKGNLKPVDSNLCIECHQGRESTNSVNAALKGIKDDEIKLRADGKTNVLGFRNIHYFAAGATLFGDLAKGLYEYDGQKYLGQYKHFDLGPAQCAQCHNVHALTVQVDKCQQCHNSVKTVEDLKNVRAASDADYDGDGDTTEGIKGEIDTMRDVLYAAIQTYAKDKAGMGIVYDPNAYPYFLQDQDGDGKVDKDAKGANIAYPNWTPRLLKAAYNYQASVKDPGQFAHNGRYVIQVLYDSLKDIGGNAAVAKMTRP